MTIEEHQVKYGTIDAVLAKELWEEWDTPYLWDQVTIDWLNTRPLKIIELILAFPPEAKVKTVQGRALDCPKPWEVGIVASYFEDGNISVVVPGRPLRAQCQPEWLEVVEYRKGLSPDQIRRYLK